MRWHPTFARPGGGDFSHATRRRFVTLDAMRGIAAIGVMLFHYFVGTSYHIFEHGYYAVDFFFALSGVVLTHSYAMRIRNRMSFVQFMKARIIRLYPLYALGSLLGAAAVAFYVRSSVAVSFSGRDYAFSLICGAMFLPYPTSGTVPFVGGRIISGVLFPLNIPAWSLFFEMLASIALFIVIRRRIKPQYIIMVSSIMLADALFYYQTPNIGWTIGTMLGGFPRTAFAFFAGVLIYRLLTPLTGLAAFMNPSVILAITAIMFAVPLSEVPIRHFSAAAGLVIWFALIPGLIFAGALVESTAEQVPLFVWLGRISYGVYAIHLPIYQLVAYLLTTAPWGRQIRNAPLLLATLSGVMVIVLAHLLTAYFDEPLRRKLRSLPFLQPIRSEISHMDRP